MNILIVTPSKNSFGGVSTMDNILESCLISLGHSVDFLTADGEKKKSIGRKIFGLPWITAKRFRNLGKEYDLVICNGEYGLFINHPRCIALFHGSYHGLRKGLGKYFPLKSRVVNRWFSFVQRLAAHKKYVVTVSAGNAEVLNEQGILNAKVIDNPVDLSLYVPQIATTNGKVLFVGANNYYPKGIDILEQIAERGIEIDMVSNSCTSPTLNYLGERSPKELSMLLPQYELLLLPSRFEASGLVLLEAMASGVPVLTSKVGSAFELEKEFPELVFDIRDCSIDQIVSKINDIVKRRDELSPRVRQYVENKHSLDLYKMEWKKYLENICL